MLSQINPKFQFHFVPIKLAKIYIFFKIASYIVTRATSNF